MLIPVTAHYVHADTSPNIFYVIELFLAFGIGAYGQNSFSVIQSVVAPKDGPHGLSLMLIGKD